MTPIPLATTRWGSGDKRALLVHGIMSSAEGWWRLAPDLVSAGYEVTAVDLRGHGGSPRGDTMALEAYSADVAAVGEAWDLVLGHSMGGAIALMVVAANPGWTQTLVLEDPALTITDQPLAMEWFTAPWTKPIDRATIASENPRWHTRDIDIKVDALRQCGRETMVRTVNDAVPWDVRGLAEAVPVPTLLLGADPGLDPIITPHLGAAIAAASRHVQFEPVAGGSHSMHRDAYDEFWAIIDRFLAGIAG